MAAERWRVAGCLAALMALQAGVFTVLGPLAPFVREGLGVPTAMMGVIGAAPYLGTALAAVPSGGWVDMGRPRQVVTVTVVGMAVALACVAGAVNAAMLACGFLLVGIARSAVPPLTDRLGLELAGARSRGLVFGVKQMGTPVGSGLVSVTLPVIAASVLGWRAAVGVLLGTVLATGLLLSRLTPVPPGPPAARSGEARALPWWRTVADPAGLAPMVRVLLPVIVFSVGLGVFMSSSMTFLTLFLVDVGGLDPVRAGVWFALFGVGGALGRIVWGWASDVIWAGRRGYPLVLCAATGGAMALCLGLFPGLAIDVLGPVTVLLFGFSASGWVGLSRAFGAEVAGRERAGRAGGILLMSMMAGGLLGPVVFGFAVGASGGYTLPWLVAGSVALVTAAVLLPGTAREKARRVR